MSDQTTSSTTNTPDEQYSPYVGCVIRDVPDETYSYDVEDGLIAPVPSAEPNSVMLEPRDGNDLIIADCHAISVSRFHQGTTKKILQTQKINARVLVTDARIVLACSKYEKGGGWYGDPISMAIFNAGSKMSAAYRRRGKMLVGQARYPWICSVRAQNKDGRKRNPMLRMDVNAGQGDHIFFDAWFDSGFDATALATQTLHRIARFRMTHEPELSEADRVGLRIAANHPGLVFKRGSGKLAQHDLPPAWTAAPRAARFGLGPDAGELPEQAQERAH